MAEKNSLWKNIRNKAKQNKRTGATPKKPSAEMLRQERKIKAKQYAVGGPFGVTNDDNSVTLYNKTQYDPNQNKTINYVGSDDNKYYMMPGDTMIQGRLPEFEVIEQGIEKPKSYKPIFPTGLSENAYDNFSDEYTDHSRKASIIRDTVIDLTNQKMGWFPFDAIPSEQYSSILGNNYVERNTQNTGNPEDYAKNWITRMANPEDTFRNKDYAEEAGSYYHSKDIPAFYGIENGKFKVGSPNDFSENTIIVPVRNSTTPYSKVDIEKGLFTNDMYTYDKSGNKIWNLNSKDKFIVYSPKTKKSFFRAQLDDMTYGRSSEEENSLVKTKKVLEDFLKENPDAYIIPIDEGRFKQYIANPSGVTENQFKKWNAKAGTILENYLIQDPKNPNTPINSPSGTGYGYNMGIIKQKAKGGFIGEDGDGKPLKKDSTLSNIYNKYPAFRNMGNVTLKADTGFTKENTGIGDIEFFDSKTKEIIYPNGYKVVNPSNNGSGIIYNPKTNTEQNIMLDMLHGMPSDPVYNKIKSEFGDAYLNSKFSEDFYNDADTFKKQVGEEKWKEWYGDDKKFFDKSYLDGVVRNLMFEGTPEDFEKNNYWQDARKEYFKDDKIKTRYKQLENYLKTGKGYVLPEVEIFSDEKKAKGGYIYNNGGGIGEDGKPVTLYKKAQYDASTDRVLEYAGTEDNKYYVTPDTPQGIDFQSRLPEFEVIQDTGMYNPDVSGYTAPQYIPSETGLIPNPNYRPLASGALEPVYPEAALLPGSLPIKATSTLGKIGVFGLETAIDNPGFGLGSTIKNTLNKQKNELFKLAKDIKSTADEFIVTPIQFRKEIAELRKLKKDYSSILNTEEGKRRLALLGIDPSKISDYDLTFKPNVGSAFGTGFDDFINKMNIDFRQVQKLKKKGHMVSPKSIFEHEFGHLLQKESYKQQGILKDLDIYNKDLIEHNKIKDRILNNPYLTSMHKSLRLQIHNASEPVKPFITPKPTLTDVGAKQLTINNSIIDNKKIAEKIAANDKLSFPEKSYSYFNHSTDVERFAHLREMRQNMIESGVIKNMYDPITSEDLAKFIANSPGDRVSSFIDTSPNNIEWLKTLLNNMPAAVPAVGVGVGIGVGALQQDSEPQQQAYGGPINPYMYYAGGPMEYGNGGKVWKHIGAGAYSLGEGILDTVTGGATDQLTDRGFEALTKLGNKNMDLSDPANARFLKTQQQIKGYGNTTAAVATGIATGNVQGAIQQGAKGLNTAFQASDWASDDFKKWSGISSQAIGIGAGIAGGALNTEGASKGASEAAAKVGEIGGKISPYVNQAVSMFGSNSQPMWQQAQAQQDLLNSPEYAAQQAFNNQQYVNQGLSFARGGTIDPPDGGPGKKPTPKRIIYVDPTTLEGKERYNSYRDSLDVFNNSLNIISYINIPEVNKEKFDEIRSKDLNLDRWSVDEYRYKQDKKNNTVKPLSDYVYSRKKGEKDPIFEAQLERDKASDKNVYTNNVEDFKEVLPDGSIKYPWSVTNGEPDWFMYTVENPYTNTTRFYSNEYWKHKNKKGDIKKDRLLEIASPNIKPIGEKYYASDKLQDQGEINYSSIETKKGSNISDTQTKDSKKWKNYRYDYQDEDIYKEPVEEVRFININKADNTIVPTRTLPQLDKLQPKQYSSYNEQPDIVGSPQQMPPTSPMSADSEGHYRTYKIHTHGEPIYQVWEPGKQWRDVSNEEFEKISGEKYLTEYKSEGGNITNNSLNLQSMKGRYNNYKNRYAKGGTFNQYGIDMIPDSAGLHHENAYGGVPIGPNALGEGGEIKMDTPDGGQYMVSDQVDGTESQMDFTFSKGGKYKELNRTLADGMKQELDKYSFGSLSTNSKLKSDLRRPNDSYAQSTIDQIKQKWQQKTEFARQRNQQEQAIAQAQQQKQLIEEEYIAAYGGRINPKKYPGLNMPKKSKGGYVYNAMTEPMLAMGGPTDPPSNKLISNDKVLGYIADMNERGMLEPGKTFQPSWYSDLEKRQIDLNKELSPVDLGRVKSLYNYKQNNRNIFGFAQGGPMVSNVQQPFNGPAAQNRGGMMMAIGGTIPGPDNDPLSQYEQFYDNKMEGLMKFNPDSSDLGQDILEENNLPFEYRIREPELTNINPRTYPSKVTPGIVGSQQPMPGLSNDATFISPYQKYLAENKPKVLDNLTFLEAEDEDGINFEYGTISNPYRKKSPASNSTTPWYDEPAYSKAARYLPLLTSAAGIATGLKNKKRSLTPERMIPQTVDLERSRITAMEEGRRALDAGLQGNIGSNMGQVAGNTRDMILNYNKNMGAQIAKIYESEANTNAQLAQQAGLANQQAGNQFKINNEEMFQNAQTMALRAAQEGAMLAQSGAEQERKQYLQEWIAKNRLNTRSYKTNIDGKDVYVSPNGQIYDEQGNPVT